MFYNSPTIWKQSIMLSLFILVVGVAFLGKITSSGELSFGTVVLYYYNSSTAVDAEGGVECSTDAILPVSRVAAISPTSTESMARVVLSELLYTPLNPIEERDGFTRSNIPEAIVIESVTQQASSTAVSVLISDSERLNDCEEMLLSTQIERTVTALDTISEVDVFITYK